jgi:sugar phosphate isomerase/epimerase
MFSMKHLPAFAAYATFLLACACPPSGPPAAEPGPNNAGISAGEGKILADRLGRFFAMNNATGAGRLSCQEQAQMLKELGYAGMSYRGAAGVAEMVHALDAHGLRLFATLIYADLAKPVKYDTKLPQAIAAMKGHGAIIWLGITSVPSSDTSHDDEAVAVVREIAAMAEAAGLKVAIYPHADFYIETLEDALRIAAKVDRPNVGVSFTLPHWLRLEGDRDYRPLLQKALPKLFLVNICGADRGGKSWAELIQPLDCGNFDIAALLDTLDTLGYTGPIGLIGWQVPGDVRENLRRSMHAFRKLSHK